MGVSTASAAAYTRVGEGGCANFYHNPDLLIPSSTTAKSLLRGDLLNLASIPFPYRDYLDHCCCAVRAAASFCSAAASSVFP